MLPSVEFGHDRLTGRSYIKDTASFRLKLAILSRNHAGKVRGQSYIDITRRHEEDRPRTAFTEKSARFEDHIVSWCYVRSVPNPCPIVGRQNRNTMRVFTDNPT